MLLEVEKSERPETALFLLLQAVPCILHMENRMALKSLQVLFQEGIRNAEGGTILGDTSRGEVQRVRNYIGTIETIVNETILGTVWDPAQWICPYDYKEKKLGPVKFENWRSRRIMENMDAVIKVSMPDGSRKQDWISLVPFYLAFMEQVRKKDDWNTHDELCTFQHQKIDEWFQLWLGLHGANHVTNYMHLLSSGHITEYVYQWGNLYEHSQQGWEAFNALIKSFFFRRTPRGGGRKKSRLKPVARWLQQRMLLLCGATKETVEAWLQEVDTVVQDVGDAGGDEDDEPVEEEAYGGGGYGANDGEGSGSTAQEVRYLASIVEELGMLGEDGCGELLHAAM